MSHPTDSISVSTPVIGSLGGQSMRSRSSTRLDDVASLTSFNPFAEEDENEQALYTLTSLLSRVKNTFTNSTSITAAPPTTRDSNVPIIPAGSDQRRSSYATMPSQTSSAVTEKPLSLTTAPAQIAPPLVSLTPAQSETPTFSIEYDTSLPRRTALYSPIYDAGEGASFGTSIPGFPIQDDARSIRTTTSLHRSGSVSKVMRRLRGEGMFNSNFPTRVFHRAPGLSKDYWMDDENCKECYDCKSVFTAWRRKHHCRICGKVEIIHVSSPLTPCFKGQIFCSRCASNIIKGTRFGQNGMIRVCNLCLDKLAKVDEDDEDDRRSIVSSVTFPAHQLGMDILPGLGHPQSPFAASQLFGRTDEPFNLYSIAETRKIFYSLEDDVYRPMTLPIQRSDTDAAWASVQDNPAPFRRALSDEGVGDQSSSEIFHSETVAMAKPNIFSTESNVVTPSEIAGTTSSIQFPVGSPERATDSPQSNRPPLQLSTDLEIAAPFIRSRVQSRIDNFQPVVEPGWRTRRESTA